MSAVSAGCWKEEQAVQVSLIGAYHGAYELLARCFSQVRCYVDAESFLAGTDANAPAAVIIVDVNLPGMTGIELIRRLRERGLDMPVIAIGDDDVATAVDAMRSGAVDFMTVPLAAGRLQGAMRALLQAAR